MFHHPSEDDLKRFADRIRLDAVKMVQPHGFGYLGQALSAAEVIAAVYLTAYRPDVDQIVCSPGHYIIVNYAAAAETGRLDRRLLETYGHEDSTLEAIGTERSPGIDLTCGSLGTGLSGAVGFALANRLAGDNEARVFALTSDGELEEGQTWEAAIFAAHHKLDRLIVLVDANNSQVDGPVTSITTLEPIAAKWTAFGWDVHDVDGHDALAIADALTEAMHAERPSIVIARTSTVHGLDVLPPDADGHFIKLPAELAKAAINELEARLA